MKPLTGLLFGLLSAATLWAGDPSVPGGVGGASKDIKPLSLGSPESSAVASPTPAASATPSIRLLMADGQLLSHPVRVFVTRQLTEAMNPRLTLMTSHSLLNAKPGEGQMLNPRLIAANQQQVWDIDGTKVQLAGTSLVFDLTHYPVHAFKPMIRVEPVLEWDDKPGDPSSSQRSVGKTVYLGNQVIVGIYTVVIVGLVVFLIILMASSVKRGPLRLLIGPDERLSLARAQTAAWTIAVGAMVLMYGLIRMEVPQIPQTLVILMGMSLVTGGVSHYKGQKDAQAAAALQGASNAVVTAPAPASTPQAAPIVAASVPLALPPIVAPQSGALPGPTTAVVLSVGSSNQRPGMTTYQLSDLISEEDDNGKSQVSIARAQLLFWTCLTLGLFISKTILEGELWDVPGQLVALMGISQASYLGPKFFNT